MGDLETVMDELIPSGDGSGQPLQPVSVRSVTSGLPALPDANIGAAPLTHQERAVLDAPPEVERFAVRPDALANGEPVIYLPHEWYRDRLREALGFGSFGFKPLKVWGEEIEEQNKSKSVLIYFWGALYVRGCFVGDSIGSAKYHPKSARQDLSDTVKSARSNAFVRCCSDAGLGTEPWNPGFCAKFAADYCIKVIVVEDGKPHPKWRLKSAKPFDGEQGLRPSPQGKPAPAPSSSPSSGAKGAQPPSGARGAQPPGGEQEITLDLDAVNEREPASDEQVAKLKALTANLNPAAVADALKQRRVKAFEELSAKQAANIIEKLSGATA